MFRKITSFILAFIMVLSMVPVQVFASETEAVAETVAETVETEPTETESVPETEETTAPIETESVAETEPAEPETSPEETLPGDEEGDTEETFAAFSETSGTCGENVTWTLADGVLTISGTGAMMEYDNQWDAPWYKNSEEIIKIIIEYGVTSIGDLSFAYCSNMMSVALANSVITIGENAFYGCKSLNSIAIPASITKIESFAFYNCKNLETVIFTGNAPYISTIAFGTDTITVYYPEDNSSWTETVDQAYYDYITWKPYFLGNHKIVIDTVVLPTCAIGGLTEGYHCSICGEIIIAQEGIHTLNHSFEEGICLNCGMQGGKCGENVEWALSSEGILKITGSGAMNDYQYDCYHFLDTVSPSRDCIREIIVGEGITSIGDLAFYNCSYSERVTLPDSVTRIGQAAFGCCKNLEEVVLPPRINEISDSLFSQCEKLKNVEINGITKIGAGAFSGCKSLTDFDIPHGVSIIRDYTFSGCEKLVNLSIPNTVTRIGNFAFAGCKSLKNVSLPESLKYLYTGAFEECTALKTVILSRNFQSIGNRAFYGCVNLTEIELPYGVDSVNEYAFYGCKNLQSIRFPESVMWIGIEAFDGCKALSEIYFVGDAPDTEANIFKDVTASVFYSNKNNTWTKSAKQQYGGKLTWIATDPIALHKTIIIPGTEPTCTEDGLTDYIYCSICNEIFSQHEKIPPLGHTEVVDPQLAPTCTKDGLSEGSHCSVCGEIIEAQMVVAALGHSAVVDDAVSPTCAKNGLLQGTHCKVCSEVLVPQEEIPALGHKFLTEASGFVCMVCGEKATLNFMQEYILLQTDEEFDLRSIVFPTEISEYVEWVLEGDSDSILIRENGTVVAKKEGTTYVTATVSDDEFQSSVRLRIDVTEVPVDGVQLNTTKATTELYSTDYTDLEILLKLPQNYTLSEQEDVKDNGVAIDSARFTDEAMADLFQISVLDDRRIQIVPTEEAVERAQANPKSVASKYTGTITVTVHSKEYETDKLTLTVKQTKPKVKATVAAFNSFYTGQSQQITVTGGTPTAIYENDAKNTAKTTAIPTWLDLENDVLTLNESAPKKSVSGKAYLLIDTEEWRIPAAVTLSVKNSYKVPGVKLAASSVTVSNLQKSAAVELQLLCTNKADTLSNLNITNITAPEGYTVENFNDETGTFTLKAANGFKSGKLTLKVTYGDITKSLTLTVKAQDVKLKLSASKVTLNKDLKDAASVTVSTVTGGYEVTNPALTFDDTKLDARYSDGKLTVSLEDGAEYGKTYPVTLCAYEGAPTVKLSVAVAKQTAAVKSTIKASGTLDVIRESTAITVKPTYTNVANVDVDKDAVLKIYTSADKYKEVFAEVKAENGIFVIDNSVISDHTLKYKAQLETDVYENEEPVKSAMISLSVKMGTAKLTVKTSGTTLFSNDKHDRALVWFETKDAALNAVSKVEIKDAKYQDKFEVIDYSNGQFAIGFRGGVPESLIGKTVTLNLNIFIEGNQTEKANTTAKVKLTIVK